MPEDPSGRNREMLDVSDMMSSFSIACASDGNTRRYISGQNKRHTTNGKGTPYRERLCSKIELVVGALALRPALMSRISTGVRQIYRAFKSV